MRSADVPRPRTRRRVSPLTLRILAINVMALALLLAGMLYLDVYRDGLLDAKSEALVTNGTIIAGALGEAAGTTVTGMPVLQPNSARTMVRRLVALTGTRARLFGERGALLADSRVLISAGRAVEATPLGGETPSEKGSWQGFLEWFGHLMRSQPHLPLYREATMQHAGDFEEAVSALNGEVVGVRRVTGDGEIIINVAFPVQRFKKILGALVLSAGTADVEEAVAEARLAIIGVFLAALAVTILLSFYLAGSIARPIHDLAEAAEIVRQRPNKRESLPDLSARGDEIGDLSRTLRDMTDALYERLDAIEGFAADVAHEIRNPLTSIKSAVEVLATGNDAEAQARLIAIIEDDVRRLDRLIGDISDASRLDAELARAEPQPVDLPALVETLVEIESATAEQSGGPRYRVEIEKPVDAGPDEDPGRRYVVLGVESRLGQVVRNLLSNAASFSPPDGDVELRLGRRGINIELVIDDAGPGLPEDKLEAVFDRFYTERPEDEAFGEHSGLGLSISRQIVAAHGGRIRAENRRNDRSDIIGARFIVTLPALETPPNA